MACSANRKGLLWPFSDLSEVHVNRTWRRGAASRRSASRATTTEEPPACLSATAIGADVPSLWDSLTDKAITSEASRPGSREGSLARTTDREKRMAVDTREDAPLQDELLREVARRARLIEANVASVILGKDEVIRACVVALLAGGHLVIEDYPGVGKTLLAKTLARSIACRFA